MTKYEDHPLAALFPLLGKKELAELADSIKRNGFHGTITLLDGKILDGRNRYRACQIAGVEPVAREHKKGDPLDFVILANLHRRHLSASQRAMIAARLVTAHRGRVSGDESNGTFMAHLTAKQAAAKLNVSTHSVKDAAAVKRKSSKKAAEIDSGTTTVQAAVTAIKKEAAKKEAVLDDTGYPVPKPARAVWDRKEEAVALAKTIAKAISAIKAIKQDGDPLFAEVNVQSVLAHLESARREFKQAIPNVVCYYCQGQLPEKCNFCKGRGVISKYRQGMVPEELRTIREASCKH